MTKAKHHVQITSDNRSIDTFTCIAIALQRHRRHGQQEGGEVSAEVHWVTKCFREEQREKGRGRGREITEKLVQTLRLASFQTCSEQTVPPWSTSVSQRPDTLSRSVWAAPALTAKIVHALTGTEKRRIALFLLVKTWLRSVCVRQTKQKYGLWWTIIQGRLAD